MIIIVLSVKIWKSCMWTADKEVNTKAIFAVMTPAYGLAVLKISLKKRYDFHIFTVIYSSLHRFIWIQHNDQLSVVIAEVMGANPVQAWIFSGLIFTSVFVLSHLSSKGTNIWFHTYVCFMRFLIEKSVKVWFRIHIWFIILVIVKSVNVRLEFICLSLSEFRLNIPIYNDATLIKFSILL